jgi:transcriptional regulator with XRE-family HTH domain
MNTFSQLWKKLAKSKKYREEFVAAQVKRGIPFQIRTMLKKSGLSQDEIALRAGLTQGVISRAANPDYGNLTLNTIIRVAAGFDVAFVGKFVPFSELAKWFTELSEETMVKTFGEEDREFHDEPGVPIKSEESQTLEARIEAAKRRAFLTGQPQLLGFDGYVANTGVFIPYTAEQIARQRKDMEDYEHANSLGLSIWELQKAS